MQQCSYTTFVNALRNQHTLLRRLRSAIIDIDTAEHTKHFGECCALFEGQSVTIYAPISAEAMPLVHRATAIIGDMHGALGSFEIFPDELLQINPIPSYCSLVLESRPSGVPLREAIYTHSQRSLHQGLEQLRCTLERYDVSHNHITLDNIYVTDDHLWHPTHNYYITHGTGADAHIFNRISALIDDRALPDIGSVHEGLAPYTTQRAFPLVGRRRRVVTLRGVGFEDERGNLVIEDIYRQATDFSEGRAVVVTKEGKMGVIDQYGHSIIEPIYDHVDYDTDEGISRVLLGSQYAEFDYDGEQLTEWRDR